EPYAPLATFSYHFGFHALVAAVGMLTGIRVISLVPIIGQLLIASVALSVAFFAEILLKDRRAGVVSAAVVGLAAAVPAAYGYWGRYPQLTGLMIQCVLLGFALIWAGEWPTPR